jgi:hypothetical protein
MTIPGRGDLSPRRRHGYGGRRRWPRVLLTLVVLAALGAGGIYGWHRWRNDDTATVTAGPPCSTPTAEASSPPVPPPVQPVRVLNGSLKSGRAARVAHQMHRRFGVQIGRVGNAAKFVRGPSLVRYPVRLGRDAADVAAAVIPPPRLVVSNSLRRVELDLGTRYRRVATRREHQRAVKGAVVANATRSPSPSGTPCPTP